MSSSTLTARFSDPAADPAEDRARLRFAVSMLGVGVMHFVAPGFFVKIVPRWFPWAKPAVFWSGVAEVGSGVLLAVPRTRRIGGWLAALTIVAVYPANIQMSVDLITPVAMEKELRFAIREGGRTVGAGVVSEIIE